MLVTEALPPREGLHHPRKIACPLCSRCGSRSVGLGGASRRPAKPRWQPVVRDGGSSETQILLSSAYRLLLPCTLDTAGSTGGDGVPRCPKALPPRACGLPT